MGLCAERCPECPRTRNPVAPDGPENSRTLFVGEGPGPEENGRKIPFCGRTGDEFNGHYLGLSGLHRGMIRVDNTVKCWPEEDDIPEARIKSCSEFHLRREIERNDPELIILMGGVACSMAGADVEVMHGFPVKLNLWGTDRNCFITYHPALGMHDGRMMLHLREDFKRLGQYLRGQLLLPHDEFPDPDYRLIETERDLDECRVELADEVAIDTENDPVEGEYSIQFSTEPGMGRMIRSYNRQVLERFNSQMENCRRWIVHNLMFDHPHAGKIGVEIPVGRAFDTMMAAYHLGNLPQSLKRLAWRLCGMEMVEYSELIEPYAFNAQLEYMVKASQLPYDKPPQELVENEKGIRLYSPQSTLTKIKRVLTDVGKSGKVDIAKRWNNWNAGDRKQVEAYLGRFPVAGIRMVPPEEALTYACRDPDATLRVYKIVRQMMAGFARREARFEPWSPVNALELTA